MPSFVTHSRRRGATGQQYAILLGLIGVVVLLSVGSLGTNVTKLFSGVSNNLGGATNGVVGGGGGDGGGPPPPSGPTGLVSWGNNSNGQIGDGTTTQRNTPVAVTLPAGTVASVGPGNNTHCAINNAGKAYCWGWNQYRAVGDGGTTDQYSPVALINGGAYTGSNMVQIAGGNGHFAGVTSGGTVVSWGNNINAILGNGNTTPSSTPLNYPTNAVYNGSNMAKISLGNVSGCGITTAGRVVCWGQGTYGRLGNGAASDSYSAMVNVTTGAILTASNAAEISAGNLHVCAVTTAGAAVCWGYGGEGELGNGGTALTNSTPVAVTTGAIYTGSNMAKISAGVWHACGATTGGRAVCWGVNTNGPLGNGNNTTYGTPQAVSTSGPVTTSNVTDISAGDYYSCALLSNGQVACWGKGTQGALGNGAGADSNVPVLVSDIAGGVTVISKGWTARGMMVIR